MNSYTRVISTKLQTYFSLGKVLLLIGARQVGKTTLLKQLTANESSVLWLNADIYSVRESLDNPGLEGLQQLIGSYKVVVIDEVQRIKNAGLLLKILADHFNEVQFIATGSSSLEISEFVFEPLTGRSIQFYLHPFSFSELYSENSDFELEQKLAFHLVYGNYPEVVVRQQHAQILLENLAQNYLYKDVLIWKDIRKPDLLDKLLKLLAWQIGNEVSLNELSNTLKVNLETVENYIDLLEKSFVVFRLPSYATNARKEITKSKKIYFWDNGIRNAVLADFKPINSRNDLGQLFENLMVSERMKANNLNQRSVQSYFWRNYNQSEVDYVEVFDNRLYAFEIKWNSTKNHRITKAFTNMYPEAETQIITPKNFRNFAF